MSVTNAKILKFLKNKSYFNTLTAGKALHTFGVKNLRARISELRKEGHAIYTNVKMLNDGRRVTYYRLGTPSKSYTKFMKNGKVRTAIKTLYARDVRVA